MNYLKQWGIPLISTIVAAVLVVHTWRSEISNAVYAKSNDSSSGAQVEVTQTDYVPPANGTIIYGKPPQDLLDLIASQQGVGAISVSSDEPTSEQDVEDPGPTDEYPVYDRGSWEAVFNHMPEEVTASVNNARTVNFSNGISAHICWCLGMRVQTYDPSIDVTGETEEGFTFYQHPISRDLIITDNKSLVAYHNTKEGYTWTFGYDGSRAIRFKDFSFYAFANGRWSIAETSGSTEIKKDGIFQAGVFDKSYGSWELDEILKVNDEMTQRFMTWLLPLNWEEVPWLQGDE